MTSTAANARGCKRKRATHDLDAAARAIRGGGRNGFVQRNGIGDAQRFGYQWFVIPSRPSRRIVGDKRESQTTGHFELSQQIFP